MCQFFIEELVIVKLRIQDVLKLHIRYNKTKIKVDVKNTEYVKLAKRE